MDHIAISSSELGTLWVTYQEKTMKIRVLEYILDKAEDTKAQNLFQNAYNKEIENVQTIKNLLQNEEAVVPAGFTEQDVNKGVPRLFDDLFDLMYLRLMAEVESGMNTLHLSMSYREDIVHLYNRFSTESQKTYSETTQYLLQKGVLARPPYVSMPKKIEFVNDKNYVKGLNIFREERALNTIELGHLYHTIESNVTGMQLMTGFAQAANNEKVKNYFIKGMELSKKIINTLSDQLTQSDIQPPSTWAGRATDSTVQPFSDKLMMYNSSLLTDFALGTSAIGAAFSLRADLPLKIAVLTKDIFNFAQEGGELMITNGWMEEPFQAEDRFQLINSPAK